jgi:hypothetical protein
MKPASVEYQKGGQRFWRPRRSRFESWLMTPTMIVGSVRGMERLERVVLVRQAGRGVVEEASVGGQTRLKPAFMERVVWPQEPQKGFRLFQSRTARDCA